MKEMYPSHKEQILALKRIEGQVRGLQKMIEDGRYCVDILTQTASVLGALRKVQENILKKHLESCVRNSLEDGSRDEKDSKINEILMLIKKFKKDD